MKKLLMLVSVLVCTAFVNPCFAQGPKIIEGNPKVIDTLSYCVGVTVATQMLNDNLAPRLNYNINSFCQGFNDIMLRKSTLSASEATKYLEKFYTETAVARVVELQEKADDGSAVFRYLSDEERHNISFACGVVIGDEIKKSMAEEEFILHSYWMCQGIEGAYTGNLLISVEDMTAFVEREDAKANQAPALPKKVCEGDIAKLDTLSYCIGAEIGQALNQQFKDLNLNIESLKMGIQGGMLDTAKLAGDEAVEKLQTFFAQTLTQRRAEFDEAIKADSTLIFKPFVSEAECNEISYAMGVDMGTNMRQSKFPIQYYWLLKAIGDAQEDGALMLSMEQMQQFMQHYFTIVVPTEAAERSTQWLDRLANEPNVQRTESGLLYKILEPGDMGRAAKNDEDIVKVHYVGKLQDGTVFDASRYEWRSKEQQEQYLKAYPGMFDENGKIIEQKPIEFPLSKVIAGWTEGMKLIGPGGKIILYIPAALAYGERGAGQSIGPNEALEFYVELIDIIPAKVEDAPAK